MKHCETCTCGTTTELYPNIPAYAEERLYPGHPDRCNHYGPLRRYGYYWCELRRGHDGEHKQLERSWPRDYVQPERDDDEW